MAKHYNVRVEIEEVTEEEVVTDRYSSPQKKTIDKKVLDLVSFKTQRPSLERAQMAAKLAVDLAGGDS